LQIKLGSWANGMKLGRTHDVVLRVPNKTTEGIASR
jgi:hypothetical protein